MEFLNRRKQRKQRTEFEKLCYLCFLLFKKSAFGFSMGRGSFDASAQPGAGAWIPHAPL
jgi:hypothetical protein